MIFVFEGIADAAVKYFARVRAFIVPTMGIFPTQRKDRAKGIKKPYEKIA